MFKDYEVKFYDIIPQQTMQGKFVISGSFNIFYCYLLPWHQKDLMKKCFIIENAQTHKINISVEIISTIGKYKSDKCFIVI